MPDRTGKLSSNNPDVSVVVPLYNEAENVTLLYERLLGSLQDTPASFELIFVDDGSRDETFATARALAHQDPRLKVIRFRRNFGQSPAMAAGIDNANGAVIVTMDGDLQNDPRDIPLLLGEIAAGADLVVGWRHQREDKVITRKIPSYLANRLISMITGVKVHDNGCSLKAYKSEVIKSLPLYAELHRFIPALSTIAGAKLVEVKVRHHARQFGESKYNLSRVYKVLFDLFSIQTLTKFAARPMRWFGLLMLPFALLTVALVVIAIQIATGPASPSLVIVSGLALVTGETAGFLLTCGALAELIYASGTARPANFWRLTAQAPREPMHTGVDIGR